MQLFILLVFTHTLSLKSSGIADWFRNLNPFKHEASSPVEVQKLVSEHDQSDRNQRNLLRGNNSDVVDDEPSVDIPFDAGSENSRGDVTDPKSGDAESERERLRHEKRRDEPRDGVFDRFRRWNRREKPRGDEKTPDGEEAADPESGDIPPEKERFRRRNRRDRPRGDEKTPDGEDAADPESGDIPPEKERFRRRNRRERPHGDEKTPDGEEAADPQSGDIPPEKERFRRRDSGDNPLGDEKTPYKEHAHDPKSGDNQPEKERLRRRNRRNNPLDVDTMPGDGDAIDTTSPDRESENGIGDGIPDEPPVTPLEGSDTGKVE